MNRQKSSKKGEGIQILEDLRFAMNCDKVKK